VGEQTAREARAALGDLFQGERNAVARVAGVVGGVGEGLGDAACDGDGRGAGGAEYRLTLRAAPPQVSRARGCPGGQAIGSLPSPEPQLMASTRSGRCASSPIRLAYRRRWNGLSIPVLFFCLEMAEL
jgi:hypothetical protein